MPKPDATLSDADGLEPQIPEPSTRRVASGSPAHPPVPAGEPNLSESAADSSDAVFAALKAQIAGLWSPN